jgi:GNAT superfamily N-acetyltransferase
MSPSFDFPIIIRNARDDEYETLGRIHAEATGADPFIKLICSQVDPDALLQWNWIDGAKASVAGGNTTVLALERADTKELIGLAAHTVLSSAKPPGYPTSFPKGYNIAVAEETEKPAIAWERGLIDTYGQVLCKCIACQRAYSDMIAKWIVITRFAISPNYQSQGLGKAIIEHIIGQAQEQRLNIGLTALSGQSFLAILMTSPDSCKFAKRKRLVSMPSLASRRSRLTRWLRTGL